MLGCWIWHTYIELNTLSQNLNAILTQSGLCQQFFGKFKQNRYEKVYNNTEQISGDIFTHLHLAYDLVPFLGYLKAFKCYIDKAEKTIIYYQVDIPYLLGLYMVTFLYLWFCLQRRTAKFNQSSNKLRSVGLRMVIVQLGFIYCVFVNCRDKTTNQCQ